MADNERAIKSNYYQALPSELDYNISLSIQKLLKNKTVPVTLEQIKGHQDKKIPYEMLSKEAQMNVQADKKAKFWWKHLRDRGIKGKPVSPTHKINIIMDRTLTTFRTNNLYEMMV